MTRPGFGPVLKHLTHCRSKCQLPWHAEPDAPLNASFVRRTVGTSVASATEDRMDWRQHITVDPNICHGQACVAGTRILVTVVLDNLAAGIAEQEIIASYPRLTREAIQACIAYAAELAREEVVGLQA